MLYQTGQDKLNDHQREGEKVTHEFKVEDESNSVK